MRPTTRITATGRVCTRCKSFKRWKSFPIDKSNTYGHRPWCRDCANRASADWKVRTEYYRKNRERLLANKRETYDPLRKKAYDLLKKYGLHIEEFHRQLTRQGGRCKLCRRQILAFSQQRQKDAVVDHCHKTGRIRGLLCHSCNRALGLMNDNPKLIKRAAVYLTNAKLR